MKQHLKYYLQSISLLLLLVMPVSASGILETTINDCGALGGREDAYETFRGNTEYIEITLDYNKDTVELCLPMEGTVTVFDPMNAVKKYDCSIDEVDNYNDAITHVGYEVGDDALLGAYRYHITADNHNAEDYWGEFHVVEQYGDAYR